MLLLYIFSFLAGVVTVLSPCILPVLPIVLSSSIGQGKKRPLGIVSGFILSFTFFTLFLTAIVKLLGIPADSLRLLSVVVIFLFGLSLLFSQVQTLLEKLFARLSRFVPQGKADNHGFGGGFVVGLSIGLLWTPCVGPILASVISLALTGTVTATAFLITLSYSTGTAIPMLAIVYGGQNLMKRVPWLLKNTGKIQKIFGVVMMLTALGIYFNLDRKFQSYILTKFPNYGVGLTQLEDNSLIKNQLEGLRGGSGKTQRNQLTTPEDMGKPTYQLFDKNFVAPELIPGGEWFNLEENNATNLPELTNQGQGLKSLRGKVILVDFWTYTCINCIRTFPYLRDWYDKYHDKGFVIIGVHTPEFEFEKEASNVAKAIDDFNLNYIVMQDNNYDTWKNYNNHYWPAEYLIDKNGKVRRTHFGEGKYDETEKAIQMLLSEAGADVTDTSINETTYQIETKTPETYLGYGRIQFLASPEKIVKDTKSSYSKPTTLSLNRFAYEGDFVIGQERAMPKKGSKLYFSFNAKDVYLVMRPVSEATQGLVKVSLEKSPSSAINTGEDVVDGIVTVDSDRLYKLLHFENAQGGELILEFLDNNIELYAFTFG